MRTHDLIFRVFASALDQIEVALCVFDREDHTLLWNETFLQFFPEHAGKIHEGEHYRENMRRFYSVRLQPDEHANLERYIEEGVQRHRNQQRPFEFDHHGYRVRVASLELWRLGRIRVWRKTQPLPTVSAAQLTVQARRGSEVIAPEVALTLESLADGVLLVDVHERIVWANRAFLAMYGISSFTTISGLHFVELYEAAWAGQNNSASYQSSQVILTEQQRFSGAPFEISLPQDRWVRIIELRGTQSDGCSYFSHVDITQLKRQQSELKFLSEKLANISMTDPLTGLANRRCFDERLKAEWSLAKRVNGHLSLMMIDVDEFKKVNDSYGHGFGDGVLRSVAEVLRSRALSDSAVVARYGGEEFAILLPKTTLLSTSSLAESLRWSVQNEFLQSKNHQCLQVTVSIGIASYDGSRPCADGAALVDLADAALYEAKRGGRNQVRMG